ncbi:CHASE domain-containing protein [Methylomonas sp. MgM2]
MKPILPSFSESRKTNRLQSLGSAYMVFGVGLLLTLSLWDWSERVYDRNAQAYFDFRVGQLLENIEMRLKVYEQVLHGARGLFAASTSVERDEFFQYVSSLHLDKRYPGIQGVGFSLIVPKENVESHAEAIRKKGFSNYRIYPPGDRDVYTSIIYLEPFANRNLVAFGYDMFSDPVRRQAMVYARDNDTVGISGKVTLVQETNEDIQAGFLMYLPVYRNGQPHNTVEDRRANIVGWVYAPFRVRDFMVGIGGERAGDLHLTIYDGDQVSEQALMYSDRPKQAPNHRISTTRELQMGGHSWTLVIDSKSGLKNWLNHNQPLTILISGMIVSIFLALLVREFISRGQALAVAAEANRELQESEARFRLMADSAPVLIWMTDASQSAIWLNKHWLDFTGRDLHQEIGDGWLESVYPSHAELVKKLLDWHFGVRKPFSVEYRLRRHDGEYRWIVNSGVPRLDENGKFIGFVGSCIDITKHKEMEEELWELATTDGLTGFLNRRHFLVRLEEEFDRMQRKPEAGSSVLMLDLDHFKRINDSYGHATGDAVLQHFAAVIRSQQRKIDVVGRVGGEEFAIILPDTDVCEARVFAERLRKSIEDRPLKQCDATINITVSIGVASLSAKSTSPDSILRNADHALYDAKENGRNQVVLFSAEDC